MPSVVLGVSGSVAAYRAADIARELMRHGFDVRACLTDGAQHFVSTALFEALTGHPCLQDVFDEPEHGRMAHIDLARQADVVVIAPATANTVAKLAWGIGDDMLTTLVLATEAPLVVAPAMNPQMYASEQTQMALAKLADRATTIVEPTEGDVACGEHGQGKLASAADIATATVALARRRETLAGKRVLITSGPTREPIDAVRYISNRSSGKMGAALARAARLMGAEVSVVAGPGGASFGPAVQVTRVETAEQMLNAARSQASDADLIIGPAAVSDYRAETIYEGKMRRTEEALQLRLVPNPDVIRELALAAPDAIVVGFAAEPTTDLSVAREKLARKQLYAIAANDVSDPSIGFESDRNALQLVFRDRDDVLSSGVRSKLECALWLLENL